MMFRTLRAIDPQAGSGARILLIEPNRGALTVMVRRLHAAGYHVVASECADQGVAELHRLPVELVLAELNMPKLSGIELVRMIRDDSGLRDTPVMFITGRSDTGAALRAFAAGADDVVVKPFDPAVLIARIERQLTRARAVRELRADNEALDARVVTRAMELGEARIALHASEVERQRLSSLVGRA